MTEGLYINNLDVTTVTISSLSAIEFPKPDRPDFDVYVPFDVNAVFANLQLAVPETDIDPTTGTPDKDQPIKGTFDATLWRAQYVNEIMNNVASIVSSHTINQTEPAALKELYADIVCELFLGFKQQDARFITSGLLIKTEDYLAPWLNGTATGGAGGTHGEEIFSLSQFGAIATQIVAGRRFTRIQTDGVVDYGQINLQVGDCIGVRVKLEEHVTNAIHVNFYLQQTGGPSVPAFTTPHTLTSNTSDADFLVTAESTFQNNFDSYGPWRCFDNLGPSVSNWSSGIGTYDKVTGIQTNGTPPPLSTPGTNFMVEFSSDKTISTIAIQPIPSQQGFPRDFVVHRKDTATNTWVNTGFVVTDATIPSADGFTVFSIPTANGGGNGNWRGIGLAISRVWNPDQNYGLVSINEIDFQ